MAVRKRRGVRGSRGRAERGHVQGRREQAGAAPAFPQPTRRLLPPAPCRAIPVRPSVPRGEPGGLRVCLSVHRHGPRASSLAVAGDRVQMRVLEPRPTRSHPGKARAPPRWCRTPVPGSCRPGGTGPTPGGGLLGGPCPRLADGRQLPVSRPALGRRHSTEQSPRWALRGFGSPWRRLAAMPSHGPEGAALAAQTPERSVGVAARTCGRLSRQVF